MKKLTDEEMTKALECCICSTSRNDCEKLNCPACKEIGCYFMNRSTEYYPESLIQEIGKSVLDLINRQKAEIERLKKKANTPFAKVTFDENELQEMVSDVAKNVEFNIHSAKSEAIKEFVERLKENYCFTDRWGKIITKSTVDNLVKEMTEVNEDE